jgi:Peptidase A4 family
MDGTAYGPAGAYDVLQAGFEAVACPPSGEPANYAWYSWSTYKCNVDTSSQPCSEHIVNNFTVNQGDDLYVTVTYNTSSPNGNAFLEDQTTGQYISIGYNQPSSNAACPPYCTLYAGYAAEWIMERPGPITDPCSLWDLADYYLPGLSWFWMYPSYLHYPSYYPPGLDTNGTFGLIYMYCDPSNWNPSANCPLVNGGGQYISDAYYWSYGQQPPSGFSTEVLYLQAVGPAESQ